MKYRLIGSAPTLERMTLLLCNYFYTNITVNDGDIYNSEGKIIGFRVIEKNGRIRFECEVLS